MAGHLCPAWAPRRFSRCPGARFDRKQAADSAVILAADIRSQDGGEDLNSTAGMLWAVLFGSAGLGFFVYGRKQQAIVPLLCGIGLMVFPYFVSNLFAMIAIGIALMAVPYFLRL